MTVFRRRESALAVVPAILLGLSISTYVRAQTPHVLADSDLFVNGVGYGSDSTDVRRAFGRAIRGDVQIPTSQPVPNIWRYDGVWVQFTGRPPSVEFIRLEGRHYATRRGLRIGDPVNRVTALYGKPCQPVWGRAYHYCRPDKGRHDPLGMEIVVDSDTVTQIIIGPVNIAKL
jgi:hypothetical protein